MPPSSKATWPCSSTARVAATWCASRPQERFTPHVGVLPHQDIIGKDQGSWLRSTKGQTFLALKPTLGEYAQHMPRATQVIYPKDLGNILIMADIFPGCRVVEAGLGSGALTMALLQAAGPWGCVTSYEVRTEQIPRVRTNMEAYLGEIENLQVQEGDIYQGIEEQDIDRVVLDVPEPWNVVPHAAESPEARWHPPMFPAHSAAGAPAYGNTGR